MMMSRIDRNSLSFYKVILLAPICMLGMAALIMIIMVIVSTKASMLEKLGAFGGLTLQWILISLPFFILLKAKDSWLNVISGLSVYVIYGYAAYILYSYSEDNTSVAESFVMLVAPIIATIVVAIALAIERIINTDNHRRINNS